MRANNEVHRDTLRRYLLGSLAGTELERVEDALLDESEQAYEELLQVEEELLESAAAGELAVADEARFLDYLSRLPEGRSEARVVHALVARAGDAGRVPSRSLRYWLAGAAALLLGVALGWVLPRPGPTDVASFEPSPEERIAAPESSRASVLVLTPGRMRSGGDIPRIAAAGAEPAVELRLDADLDPASSYRAVLRDADGNERVVFSGLTVRQTDELFHVSLWLVPDQLPRGDYVILLGRERADGDVDPEERYDLRLSAP